MRTFDVTVFRKVVNVFLCEIGLTLLLIDTEYLVVFIVSALHNIIHSLKLSLKLR